MKHIVVALAIVLVSAFSLGSAASAQTPPQFKLGFKMLADMIPDVVGVPLENEYFNVANGNSEQHTTKGLMVWRKIDNWTAFTDGYMTWINGPYGVQRRLNTERFPWEKDPLKPAAPPATPTPAPVPAVVSAKAGLITINGKQYLTNLAWQAYFDDGYLLGALALAYNYGTDWREVADAAAARGTRVRWGTLPPGTEGAYSASDNTITINANLRSESSLVHAAVLAHEAFHAAGGSSSTAFDCLQSEVNAFRWEAYVWNSLPRGQSATSVEQELDGILKAWLSGDDELKNFVLTSPGYQAQCLGKQIQ